jgi:hypothetical protein
VSPVGAFSGCSGFNLVSYAVMGPIVCALQVTFAAVVRFGLVWERRNLTGNWQ